MRRLIASLAAAAAIALGAPAAAQQPVRIIGVTHGSMGTPPGSIPPGDLRREPEDGLELKGWANQWLTPPPPATR